MNTLDTIFPIATRAIWPSDGPDPVGPDCGASGSTVGLVHILCQGAGGAPVIAKPGDRVLAALRRSPHGLGRRDLREVMGIGRTALGQALCALVEHYQSVINPKKSKTELAILPKDTANSLAQSAVGDRGRGGGLEINSRACVPRTGWHDLDGTMS